MQPPQILIGSADNKMLCTPLTPEELVARILSAKNVPLQVEEEPLTGLWKAPTNEQIMFQMLGQLDERARRGDESLFKYWAYIVAMYNLAQTNLDTKPLDDQQRGLTSTDMVDGKRLSDYLNPLWLEVLTFYLPTYVDSVYGKETGHSSVVRQLLNLFDQHKNSPHTAFAAASGYTDSIRPESKRAIHELIISLIKSSFLNTQMILLITQGDDVFVNPAANLVSFLWMCDPTPGADGPEAYSDSNAEV